MTFRISPEVADLNPRIVAIEGDSKGPRVKGWTEIQDRVDDHLRRNGGDFQFDSSTHHRYGIILDSTDLVLDVDVHAGQASGFDSLDRLKADTGIDLLADATFITESPSGGLHCWFKKPANVKFPKSVAKYAGLDWISKGGQVIGAGSTHTSGGIYRVREGSSKPSQINLDILSALRAQGPEAASQAPSASNPDTVDRSQSVISQFDSCRNAINTLRSSMESLGYRFKANGDHYTFTRPNKTDHSFSTSGTLGKVNNNGKPYLHNFSTSDCLLPTGSMSLSHALKNVEGLDDRALFVRIEDCGYSNSADEMSDAAVRRFLEAMKNNPKRVFSACGKHSVMLGDMSVREAQDKANRLARGEDVSDQKEKFEVMSFSDLVSKEFTVNYLVEGVLVEGQPAIICGPSKSLKTNNSVALSVALASGTKFLGRYETPEKKKVLFMSAESGGSAIKSSLLRIMESSGVVNRDMEGQWNYAEWVPHTKIESRLEAFRRAIKKHRPDVVFIDPVYQATDGEDSANVQKMGQQFATLADIALDAGCTPIFVHHTKKNADSVVNSRPLELRDMQGAGVSEYFRQWILINRRSQFKYDGKHELWMSIGGSQGHSSALAIDIDEVSTGKAITGFKVSVRTENEEKSRVKQEKDAERSLKDGAKARVASRNVQEVLWRIHASGEVVSVTDYEGRVGNTKAAKQASEELRKEGVWKAVPRVGGKGKVIHVFKDKLDLFYSPISDGGAA